MKSSNPSRRGFTLVELLVVISIIALLIAILLPSLSKARQQAKITKCGTQLHAIGLALASYNTEFGRFPLQNTLGNPGPNITRDERLNNREAGGFWAYSVHEEIASYMGGLQQSADRSIRSRSHEVFYCPFAPAEQLLKTSDDDVSMADILSGTRWNPDTNQPENAPNPNGDSTSVVQTEDFYLHIGYAYMGGLNECVNDPALDAETDMFYQQILNQYPEMGNRIENKKKKYTKLDANSTMAMMSDMVSAWQGGRTWRINHGQGWGSPLPVSSTSYTPPKLFKSHVMYGDSHVEAKSEKYFEELLSPPVENWRFVRSAATLTFGGAGDMLWW